MKLLEDELNYRDLVYLKNLLDYEKEQMEKANVSTDFFEYKSISKWIKELDIEIQSEIKKHLETKK